MKRWLVGLLTIATTFGVTLIFVVAVARGLEGGSDQIRLPLLVVAAVVGLLGAIGFLVVAFSLYDLVDGQRPLGLPEGSVRALLALLLLVVFSAMTIFFFGALNERESLPLASRATLPQSPPPGGTPVGGATVPGSPSPGGGPAGGGAGNPAPVTAAAEIAKQVLTLLGTLLTAVAAFYFGSQPAAGIPISRATPQGGVAPEGVRGTQQEPPQVPAGSFRPLSTGAISPEPEESSAANAKWAQPAE